MTDWRPYFSRPPPSASSQMTPAPTSALRGRSSDFYAYVSNGATNEKDPLGLWQSTIGGGYGVGVLITFGHNNGQWNFGLDIGGGWDCLRAWILKMWTVIAGGMLTQKVIWE
jgi:hypothetical protein